MVAITLFTSRDYSRITQFEVGVILVQCQAKSSAHSIGTRDWEGINWSSTQAPSTCSVNLQLHLNQQESGAMATFIVPAHDTPRVTAPAERHVGSVKVEEERSMSTGRSRVDDC
jgi:hypothetical protein